MGITDALSISVTQPWPSWQQACRALGYVRQSACSASHYCTCGSSLYLCHFSCEGLSGRALRKLPFIAHALFCAHGNQPEGVETFLDALHRGAQVKLPLNFTCNSKHQHDLCSTSIPGCSLQDNDLSACCHTQTPIHSATSLVSYSC